MVTERKRAREIFQKCFDEMKEYHKGLVRHRERKDKNRDWYDEDDWQDKLKQHEEYLENERPKHQ